MNKEQIKDEIILTVKKAIADNAEIYDEDYISADSNDTDHMAEQVAENLYNAGYRKTFTSDLASDTQKAYKEGYIKGIEERKAENERLTERLKQVLLSIDTVKEMNAMCNINEQRKQAVKEFAEMLIEDFIKSADNQELSTVKGVLKNVCPAKVNKIKKRFEKEYEQ